MLNRHIDVSHNNSLEPIHFQPTPNILFNINVGKFY